MILISRGMYKWDTVVKPLKTTNPLKYPRRIAFKTPNSLKTPGE
jgi:hypothetical protein